MINFPLLPGDIVSYYEPFSGGDDGPFRGIAVGPINNTDDWRVDFSAIGFNAGAQIPLEYLTLIYPVGSNPFDLEEIT